MSDLPCGVPCAAGGELCLFQQDGIVTPAFVAEMIGKPYPHNAAAHDHNAGLGWKFCGHGLPSFFESVFRSTG